MDFNAAELEALDSDFQQKALFIRATTTEGVLRIWFGVAPFVAPPLLDLVYDPGGASYNGCGEMMSAPIFQQIMNGSAERLEFMLSGTSPTVAALATAEADTVKRQPVAMGLGLMGPDWQMLGNIHWCWRGVADFVEVEISGASAVDQQTTNMVKMSVASSMTGRRRGGRSYWTDTDFRQDHPGDRICERTLRYSNQIQKEWPRWALLLGALLPASDWLMQVIV